MNSLELIKLNKHYGRKHALKNFSFTFTNGIYGFLNIMFKFLEEENPTHLQEYYIRIKAVAQLTGTANRYINWASLTVNILDLCRSSRNCTVI